MHLCVGVVKLLFMRTCLILLNGLRYWFWFCHQQIHNKSTSPWQMLSTSITSKVQHKMDNVPCLLALQLNYILITSCDSGTAVKIENITYKEKKNCKTAHNLTGLAEKQPVFIYLASTGLLLIVYIHQNHETTPLPTTHTHNMQTWNSTMWTQAPVEEVQYTRSEATVQQQQTSTVQSSRLDRSPDLQPDKITQRLPVSPAAIPSQSDLSLPSNTAPSQPQIAPITA